MIVAHNIEMINIPTIHIELLGEINMYIALGIQIVIAIFLGGLIGSDREKKLKAAGIKTHILICIGATLYTAISLLNQHGTVLDPNRVSAQVVSGIGFLGAGAILHGKGGIYGLTTAATIWVVAAIGVAIGSGFPLSAALFTVTVVIVLKALGPLYRFLEGKDLFHLIIKTDTPIRTIVDSYVEHKVHKVFNIEEINLNEGNACEYHYYVQANLKNMKHVNFRLKEIIAIKHITYRKLSNLPESIED